MTILKYILTTGAADGSELIRLKREDPQGYDTLVRWAHEQAVNLGVPIEASVAK